ncbi:MAG: FlgD immunoglobulin-like domain containing protein, partial [bacterium]|nr:FlgD immunoglobulin-like domain containing protein [bacterium]
DADNSGSLTPGDFIRYTIKLTNSGKCVATNVVFTDTIPRFTTYVEGSAATSRGNIVSTSPVLRVEIDNIAPNSAETVTISFQVQLTAAASQIGNQGWVSSRDSGLEPSDDPDTDTLDDPTYTRLPSFSGDGDFTKTAVFEDRDNSKTLSPGDLINYTIIIENSGPGIAHEVTFTDTLPAYTIYVEGSASTSKGVVESTSPILKVAIGDIGPNRTERITITFQVELTDAVEQIANQGFLRSDEIPERPTDDPSTETRDDATVVDNSRFYTNLSIRQFVRTDSFSVSDSDTTHFADESETYHLIILIENSGALSASDISLQCSFPDSIEPLNIVPGNYKIEGDTIFWKLDSLSSGQNVIFQYDSRLSSVMPEGENLLIHTAMVSAANEDPSYLSDNTAADTVWNIVMPLLFPQIEAFPRSVDVADSIQIRIQIPPYKADYDLWIHLPDGQINKEFADHFWQTTPIQPEIWYDIPLKYYPDRLTTDKPEEELIFEIRTFDRKNREAHARTSVMVHSSNYLVLDRNVFRPDIDQTLGISFKLSYQRNAKLDIYDLSGKLITTITEDNYQGGWSTYQWDGISANGQLIGSGVYIVTLRSGEFKDWKKFIIIR